MADFTRIPCVVTVLLAAFLGAACADDGRAKAADIDGGARKEGGSHSTAGTSGSRDAATDARPHDGFVIAEGGESRTLTFSDGSSVTIAFPSSAAGQRISLRVIDDASIDHAGEFPRLVEMLPHGLKFDPPARLTATWKSEVPPVVATFATPDTARDTRALPVAADGMALELAHFSYLIMSGWTQWCQDGTAVIATASTYRCCPKGGEITSYMCVRTHPCETVRIEGEPRCTAGRNECSSLGIPQIYVDQTCALAPVLDSGASRPEGGKSIDASGGVADAGGGSRGDGSSAVPDAGGSGGPPHPPAVGGCPKIGYYSASASGSCGDVNTQAPRQRLDGTTCSSYLEFDGTLGISSGVLAYAAAGITQGLMVKLGSGTYTCQSTVAGDSVTLDCLGGAGETCALSLMYTGPL